MLTHSMEQHKTWHAEIPSNITNGLLLARKYGMERVDMS